MRVNKINLVLVFSVLLFFSCRKEKASWNSDWVVPLVNDTLSLDNLVNDSTINADLGTFYQVDLSRTILDLGIEDIVSIPDTVIYHTFNMSVSSIDIPPGFSVVNEVEEHTIGSGSVQLKKIRVKNGSIVMTVYNPMGTKAYFTVQLPGVSKDGVEFEEQYVVDAGTSSNPSSETAVLDISGYDIDLRGVTGGSYNKLQSKLIIVTDPLGPTVTVTNSQIFRVDADFKNIKVDYARGYFGNLIVSDTSDYMVELFNSVASGSVDLPSPSIQFLITNGMKVDAKATITKVVNTNAQGNTVNLTNSQIGSPIYIDPASGSWSTLTNSTNAIVFNGSNSNIESYLENLGNTQTIGYKFELNPWGNTSGGWNEIFPTSRIKVKLNAQMPLAIGADGLTLKDTFNFDVEQDFEKSHVESGIFVLNATNAFPFSGTVKLYLMDDAGIVLNVISGSSEISSSLYGSIDPNDGKQKMSSEVNFILTEEIIKNLALIKNVAVETELNTPDPINSINQQVLIPVGAFIAVKLKAKLNLKAIL